MAPGGVCPLGGQGGQDDGKPTYVPRPNSPLSWSWPWCGGSVSPLRLWGPPAPHIGGDKLLCPVGRGNTGKEGHAGTEVMFFLGESVFCGGTACTRGMCGLCAGESCALRASGQCNGGQCMEGPSGENWGHQSYPPGPWGHQPCPPVPRPAPPAGPRGEEMGSGPG